MMPSREGSSAFWQFSPVVTQNYPRRNGVPVEILHPLIGIGYSQASKVSESLSRIGRSRVLGYHSKSLFQIKKN